MKQVSSNFTTTFTRRLKKLLSDQDVSVMKLAELCSVNKSTAYYWLQGKCFPNDERLNTIAKYFGVSKEYLIGKEDLSPKKEEERTIPDSIDTFEEAREFLKSLNLYAYGGIDLNQKSESDIITLARTILSTLQIQGKL